MKNLQGIWRRIAGPQNPSEDESKVDRTRRGEIAGALDATLHGMATTVGPLLLFASLLGPQAVPAGLWATFITALLPPFVVLLLRGHPALVLGSRSASLLAYIGLVMLLGQAAGGVNVPNAFLTAEQLAIGLAAGSFMFFAASSLVLLAGLLRMGNLFKMIPSTVSSGISNSIALLLAWLAFQQAMHNGWLAGLVAVAMFTSSSVW
ncbi:MAG: hypothetical protein H7346_20895, partial [Burkholderiaceae bacterium]|nr:hypothetical protein [Burkholderiaceae bacterium]